MKITLCKTNQDHETLVVLERDGKTEMSQVLPNSVAFWMKEMADKCKDNEPMIVNVAVFNANGLDLEKAKVYYIRRFGESSFDSYIQPFIDNGLMSIFQVPPNKYTLWYTEIVAVLVNDRYCK